MDENQLKYKRLYQYSDEDLHYKIYRVILNFDTYVKKICVRACCVEEIHDTTKTKVISIKQIR